MPSLDYILGNQDKSELFLKESKMQISDSFEKKNPRATEAARISEAAKQIDGLVVTSADKKSKE